MLLAVLQWHPFNLPLLVVAGSASWPTPQTATILVAKSTSKHERLLHCPAGSSSGGRHFLAYTRVGCIVARQDDGFQSLEVSFHDVR